MCTAHETPIRATGPRGWKRKFDIRRRTRLMQMLCSKFPFNLGTRLRENIDFATFWQTATVRNNIVLCVFTSDIQIFKQITGSTFQLPLTMSSQYEIFVNKFCMIFGVLAANGWKRIYVCGRSHVISVRNVLQENYQSLIQFGSKSWMYYKYNNVKNIYKKV